MKIKISYLNGKDEIVDLGNDVAKAFRKQSQYVLKAKNNHNIKSITWEEQ